jgi:uncharacterized protein YjiS (DUF1127 family)
MTEGFDQINSFVLFRASPKLCMVGVGHPGLPTQQEPAMTTRSISISFPSLAPIGTFLRGFARTAVAAVRVVQTRRTLLEMDARMLKDIGITHGQAIEEARRAPWDISTLPRRR